MTTMSMPQISRKFKGSFSAIVKVDSREDLFQRAISPAVIISLFDNLFL